MLAFSTSWNSGRHTSGEEMLREIKALGFDVIEVGAATRVSLMPGVQEMLEKGEMRVCSVHNFSPMTESAASTEPETFHFSSSRRVEREKAMEQAMQTIDLAERLKAPMVVLHCGGAAHMRPITKELIRLAENGQLFSRGYVRMKIDAVRSREQCSSMYMARVKQCLQPIASYAAGKNIRIGIEARRRYEEIPSEREIPRLLEEMAAPNVGYWHDMGHIQTKENLGFISHQEWLRTIRPRTIGCHIHDVIWPAKEHVPPFLGDTRHLDFLARLVPPGCPLVWKVSPRHTAREIMDARCRWKEQFNE